jgi:hypothetical protein
MTPTENHRYWDEHLQQWKNSDMTQIAYCREHVLCPNKFSYYKKVRSLDKRPLSLVAPKPSGFIRVPVQVPLDKADEPLTLHFTSGVRLSGIADNNIDVVKQLLSVFS